MSKITPLRPADVSPRIMFENLISQVPDAKHAIIVLIKPDGEMSFEYSGTNALLALAIARMNHFLMQDLDSQR